MKTMNKFDWKTWIMLGIASVFLLLTICGVGQGADTFTHHRLVPGWYIAYDTDKGTDAGIAATMDYDTATGRALAIRIQEVRIHLESATTANRYFNIQVDSGVTYGLDTLLLSTALGGVTNYVWRPADGVWIRPGDVVKFDLENPGSQVQGLEVIYEVPSERR